MQFSVGQKSLGGLVVPGLLLSLCASHAFASGFQMRAHSASSNGVAGASDVAGTSDVSAMFTNPAALSAFKGTNFSVGGSYILPTQEFSNGKRTVGTTGVEATTDSDASRKSDDFINAGFIPAIYGSYQVNDSVVAGASVTVPFYTQTDYGKDWIGRYHGTKTELQVVALDLAASYQLADNLKLGVGLQVQQGSGVIEGAGNYGAAYHQGVGTQAAGLVGTYYAAAKAVQADPTNTTKQAAFAKAKGDVEGNTLATKFKSTTDAALAQSAQADVSGILTGLVGQEVLANEGGDDVYAKYEGKHMGFGFTFGALYTPMTDLDLGFSYRSQVVHKTEGDYTLTGATPAAQAYAESKGTKHDAKFTLPLPDIIGLGAVYKGVADTQLFASASLTRWSKLRDLNVRPDGLDNVLVKLDWKDSMHIGVGGAYKFAPSITGRVGIASDRTPTTDALRSPRSPDNDRMLYSLGGRYEGQGWSVDASFMHVQIKDPTLALKADAYPQANERGDLTGDYTVSANTISAQYNMAL